MNRRLVSSLLLSLFLATRLQAAEPDSDKEKLIDAELKLLQGTWKVTEIELDGKKSKKLAGLLFVFKDATVQAGSEPEKEIVWKISLDPTTNPKQINIFSSTAKDEKPALGIYQIENDVLKLCMGSSDGGNRPKSFEAPKDSSFALNIMTRVQDENEIINHN
jgi:uncharacterized protein (TIGR03067 family)